MCTVFCILYVQLESRHHKQTPAIWNSELSWQKAAAKWQLIWTRRDNLVPLPHLVCESVLRARQGIQALAHVDPHGLKVPSDQHCHIAVAQLLGPAALLYS